MAQRIALTRIELGNSVGANWSVLRAQAQYSSFPLHRTPLPSPSANLRVNDEERPSNRTCAARPASES
jgi:hypothetical protein